MSIFASIFAPIVIAAAVGHGGIYPGENGPVPQAVSDVDQPIADRAQAALASLEGGTLDPTLLTPSFRQEFTKDVIAADASFLKGRGAPTQFLILQRDDQGTRTRYTFVIGFKDGNWLSYTLGINKTSDLIDALYFRPANPPQ